MNNTIYTIKTCPNSSYGHGDATQEEIDIFDTNIHNVLKSTTDFFYVDSRNENTDQPTDVYSTSGDIIISHGVMTNIEPHDEDSDICDITIDFYELVTMPNGFDPYIKFEQKKIDFLANAIDMWFAYANPA